VELRDGVLVVNGRPAQPVRQGKVVRETLANETTYQTQDLGFFRQGDNFGPVRVPADAWFLLGDNRDEAKDSRQLGVVAQSDICGVAYRVLYSRDAKRIGRRP
jgi:signal peptidase I